jgi:hypothetical protein
MRYAMTPENLIQEYLSALEKSDVNKIFQLFKEDAIVVSPLYGEIKASHFYPELFEDTLASKITLKDIYYSSSVKNRIAAHFVYDWKMRNESYVEFECMDVFELDKPSEKIEKLTIIYDSRQTRDEFDNLKSSGKLVGKKPSR